MSKKMKGVMDDFEIIFTPDGDLSFNSDKDYVLSGGDVNELQDIANELRDAAPELAAKIDTIINNIVEI